MKRLLGFLLASMLVWGCTEAPQQEQTETAPVVQETQIEAYSLDGKALERIPDSPATFRKKDSLLRIAKAAVEADPENLDNIIWHGRRTAYLSRYNEAIDIYTEGLKKHPDSPELYRHRGHRYISIRKFEEAIADFEKAAELAKDREIEIEPDGLPNKLNIPLSSLQFNIWYHLALAHYLRADFVAAAKAWEKCMVFSVNPDLQCATSDWLYMTYLRIGEEARAKKLLDAITPDMLIIENAAYHQRLLMYKGLVQPEELLDFENADMESRISIVTQGYGVGNYWLAKGEKEKALQIFQKVIETGYWSAFGYIAAEVDLYLAR